MKYDDLSDTSMDDVKAKLIAALCAEWLAYYQYWWAHITVEGPEGSTESEHFKKHAEEEKEHIDMLAERMNQLGINPVFNPAELTIKSSCKYPVELENNVANEKLLNQIVTAEACAVAVYQDLLKHLKDDVVTENIVQDILRKEVEHLSEMSKELKNIEWYKHVYTKG